MTLNELLHAGNAVYGYSEDDKAIIRQMANDDKPGLIAALESDPLLPWAAYQHGLIDLPPKGN